MSKVTSKLDNLEIINAAKQRYEAKQKSKLPTVIVDLSSQGKIYPETSPLREGCVEMRYMTAKEEDILTSQSLLRKGVAFDKVLESLIVEKVDLDSLLLAFVFPFLMNLYLLSHLSFF